MGGERKGKKDEPPYLKFLATPVILYK